MADNQIQSFQINFTSKEIDQGFCKNVRNLYSCLKRDFFFKEKNARVISFMLIPFTIFKMGIAVKQCFS